MLISAQLGISDQVQVLDLRDNTIVSLDASSFEGLVHLHQLWISSNYIHTVELDTFASLHSLRNLSLADNRIEWFDHRIVEQAASLQWLDLSGNKLMEVDTEVPLLRSRTLLELYLRASHISFISAPMLSELPALQRLDLADNLLITLQASTFVSLPRLVVLDVVNNPFNCDGNMLSALSKLKRRKVHVINWDCLLAATKKTSPPVGGQMFERMMAVQLATTEVASTLSTKLKMITTTDGVDLLTVWHQVHTNPDGPALDDESKVRHELNACQKNLAMCRDDRLVYNHDYTPVVGGSRFASIKPAMFAGILIGTLLGGCSVYTLMVIREACMRNDRRRKPLRRTYVIRERTAMEPDISPSDELLSSESIHATTVDNGTHDDQAAVEIHPPYAPSRRRAPRRHQRRNDLHMRRETLGRRETLYNWLFDRPAHRRYVRTLSQSTSNLVRRLSQSRLFLNFNERQTPAASVETSPNDAPGAPAIESRQRLRAMPIMCPVHLANDWRESSLPPSPTASVASNVQRPETPPPMYADVVKVAPTDDP